MMIMVIVMMPDGCDDNNDDDNDDNDDESQSKLTLDNITKLDIPLEIKLSAAFFLPSRVRNSLERALPITVPP